MYTILINYTGRTGAGISYAYEMCKAFLNNGVNVYFYLTPYHPTTYDILISQEKYKIINEVEIYVKEFAKQNNIKVVGSYNPHLLNLKNEHFFDGMHSLDEAYEIIFKDLLK